MELVIKISERIRVAILNGEYCGILDDRVYNAIKDGTPLPEGHGRLIDADSMKTMKNIQSANFNAVELIRYWIDNQPTIIEADKENNSEDNN